MPSPSLFCLDSPQIHLTINNPFHTHLCPCLGLTLQVTQHMPIFLPCIVSIVRTCILVVLDCHISVITQFGLSWDPHGATFLQPTSQLATKSLSHLSCLVQVTPTVSPALSWLNCSPKKIRGSEGPWRSCSDRAPQPPEGPGEAKCPQ